MKLRFPGKDEDGPELLCGSPASEPIKVVVDLGSGSIQERGGIAFEKGLLIGGIVAILGATLWPFTFELHPLRWAEYVSGFELVPSTILDLPSNILLFMPFGFGLASLLDRRGSSHGAALLLTLLTGLLATAGIESLQHFLPDRTASVSDVIANTLGAVAGLSCFRAWQRRRALSRWAGARLTPGNIAVIFSAYVLLMLLLVWGLMRGMLPGGWDTNYRLALGNEVTRDRPWRGTVQDLLVLDRAVDGAGAAQLLLGEVPAAWDDAVVAEYPLRGKPGLRDPRGVLPDLVPQTAEAPEFRPSGVALEEGLWLASERVVSPLADRINTSRQFTVALTVATFDLTQAGPARIVTVSEDPFHRNLTLGQAETRLALRWRSPLTGENGMTPELQFPGVFSSFEPQRVVISYDGITASIYTAGGAADLNVFLGPEVGFTAILRENSYWAVKAGRFAFWQSALLLSALIFLPLGLLLGTAVRVAMRRRAQVGLMLGGLFLPALLLEGFVAAYRNGELRLGMIALGITVTSLGFVVMQLWPLKESDSWDSCESTALNIPPSGRHESRRNGLLG